MKIGIILTGFNMEEYVGPCLEAWLKARNSHLDGHEYFICAVSVPFTGFPNDQEDRTTDLLRDHVIRDNVDYIIDSPRNIPETTARGMALNWLKGKKIDIVLQVDLDEFYTIEDISKIFNFVELNQFVAWFRLSLKNYVFDNKTYLEEPFTPARIHRIKYREFEAETFWADNNIHYGSRDWAMRDVELSNMTIPPSVAFVRHLTWMNNDRSRRKVEYHENHFNSRPSGVRSSYRWDDNKGLVFNEAYYKYVGQLVPKLLSD